MVKRTAYPVAGIKEVGLAIDAAFGRQVADGAGRTQGDAHFASGIERRVGACIQYVYADIADTGAAYLAAVLDIYVCWRAVTM